MPGSIMGNCIRCGSRIWIAPSTVAMRRACDATICEECGPSPEESEYASPTPQQLEEVSRIMGRKVTAEEFIRLYKKYRSKS